MTGRQRLCLTAFLPFLLSAQPDRITLENQYLKLQINPVGGRIEKLHMKERNLELTSKDGLLGDNFYHVPDARFFLSVCLTGMNQEKIHCCCMHVIPVAVLISWT